jgi:spore maturation protein CgeB
MTKPRVLVSYFFGPRTIPLGEACASGFEAAGCDVFRFNSQLSHPLERYGFKWLAKLARGLRLPDSYLVSGHPWSNAGYRERCLEEAVARFRPDVLFVIRGNSFGADFLARIKRQYKISHTVGWWVKDPRPNDSQLLNDRLLYDHYFCIHRHGYTPRDFIQYLPALGLEDRPPLPAKDAPTPVRTRDIVLVGGWSQRREQFVRAILDLRLTIVGPGWKKRGRLEASQWSHLFASQLWGRDVDALYRSAKIVVNVTSWDPALLTGLNLRICDVPALGAFLLTDAAPELAEFAEPGRHLATFTTPEDLRVQVIHYLAHEAEREAIARAGLLCAATKMETYTEKMARLLDAIGLVPRTL